MSRQIVRRRREKMWQRQEDETIKEKMEKEKDMQVAVKD